MEFTELKELDDMITYSKSFKPSYLNTQKMKTSIFSEFDIRTSYDLNYVSVEELIDNSLKSEMMPENNILSKIAMAEESAERKEGEEDIESLIKDIEQSMRKFDLLRENSINNQEQPYRKITSNLITNRDIEQKKKDKGRKTSAQYEREIEILPMRTDSGGGKPAKKAEDTESGGNQEEGKMAEKVIEDVEEDDDNSENETNNGAVAASSEINVNSNNENNENEVPKQEEKSERQEKFKRDKKKAVSSEDNSSLFKHHSILVLGDINRKHFEKVREDKISQSFTEKRVLKSHLSLRLHGKSRESIGGRLQMSSSLRTKQKNIKVFFFVTPKYMVVPVDINSTVMDVIKTIMEHYQNNTGMDQSLLKYPSFPEAYELRFLEEDDDCKPEMSFDPLEKDRKFVDYNIDSLAFCEIANFKPLNRISTANCSTEKDLIKEKEKEFEKIIISKKNNIPISVTISDENYSTLIALEPDKLVKDIFPKVQNRIKLNPKKYLVMAIPSEEDAYNSENLWEPEEVDINMPLKNLKTNKLQLIKKVYADEPNPGLSDSIKPSSLSKQYNILSEGTIDPSSVLLNEVQASKYEEFEVIKINTRGKRQIRLLGIDQFKIYNKPKEKNPGGIGQIFTLFTGTTAKNPERLIEKIKEIRILNGNQFYIEVFEENTTGRTKVLTYETKDSAQASYIIAKLRFILKMDKTRKRNKSMSQRD